MSKYAKLTVRVPVDDALHVAQLRDHLRDILEERGIEALDLFAEPDGEANGAVLAPRKGRIYWPAAEVVMAIDRPPPSPGLKAGKRTRTGGEHGRT
jgi:hypothetical protein